MILFSVIIHFVLLGIVSCHYHLYNLGNLLYFSQKKDADMVGEFYIVLHFNIKAHKITIIHWNINNISFLWTWLDISKSYQTKR